MTLSDLELVQQAMAPTESAAAAPATTTTTTTTTTSNPTLPPAADPLAGIDLSQLTDADHAALQPILDALRASVGADGEDGGDLDVEGILNQMDAADSVADTLEGRLDSLLANLGKMEAEGKDK